MPAVAAIGAVGSVLGGVAAMKSASGARKSASSADAYNQMMAELAKARWDYWQKWFAPLEQKLLAESQLPASKDPNFLAMRGNMEDQYANSAGNMRRMLGGRYQYGAGLEGASMGAMGRARLKDLGNLESSWEQKRWDRMLGLLGMGRDLPGQAMSGLGQAASGAQSLANMYGQQAAGAWQGAGASLGNMMQMYMMNKFLSTPQTYGGYPGAGTYGVNPSPSTQWQTWH